MPNRRTTPKRIQLVQAFDAYAGSQRVAAQLTQGLRARGHMVRVRVGFGRSGFLADSGSVSRFADIESVLWRKLCYPLWLLAANVAAVADLFRGVVLWVNGIHAAPAALPFLLFAPHRLVLHVHETGFPALFQWLLMAAGHRGVVVLSVSAFHAARLPVPTRTLPNGIGDMPPVSVPGNRLIFVGNRLESKGFSLFVDVARRLEGCGLEPVGYLAGGALAPGSAEIAVANAAGVRLVVGETDPSRFYREAWLLLQLTDPALWTETFSLVAAESVWHLVPVGAAGAEVVDEVAAGAVAFNIASRDPQSIADAIRALQADPVAHAALVAGCAKRREDYRLSRFLDGAEAVLDDLSGRPAHG